jgi:glycosyltransferase involved in cell wall biosynthesis
VWQKLFIVSLRKSDQLIVIGRDMKIWIESHISDHMNISYIPLWQDDELIVPVSFENNDVVAEYGLKDSFVVQYSGNMGLWNDMKTIGKAVMLKPSGVRFLFIGDGMRKREFVDSFEGNIPSNFLILPFQPNATFKKSVSACHAALVSLGPGLEGMAVPSKIYGIMAAGIPVVALVPPQSEIAMIVKEENCGIVVEPGDFNGLNDAVLLLKSDKLVRQHMGTNGRKAFEEKYTTRKVAEQYKNIIRELNFK